MFYKIVTYNIHKGFNLANTDFILNEIKTILTETNADFICLQEIIGHHQEKIRSRQLEFLADQHWPHYSYGKNAVYPQGDHGNAIMSKFPINYYHNIDLTLHRFEQRGLLHTQILINNHKLHLLTTHLNLFEFDRLEQIQMIIQYINNHIDENEPLILCGDFNDWTGKLSHILFTQLNLSEAFLKLSKRHAKTFPCFYPVLPLDRIYSRNILLHEVKILKPMNYLFLSDHLPMSLEFKL